MAASRGFHDLTLSFILLLSVATLGPLLFGYHLAELNAPQQVITCAKQGINPTTLSRLVSVLRPSPTVKSALPQCIPMNTTQFGLVSSFFTLGGLVGALAIGTITTRYGRLRAMILSSICAAIGPVFEALALNTGIFTVGRFISGLGAGSATVVVPIYISEVAPPGQKGFFGSFTQVMTNGGILIAQLLGLFLSRGQLWRIILGVGGAIALVQTLGLMLAGQESPKWLADNGRSSQAKKVLQKIRGHKASIEDEVKGWGLERRRDIDDEEQTLLSDEDHMHEHSADQGGTSGSNEQQGSAGKAAEAGKDTAKAGVGFFAVIRHPDYSPAVVAVVMVMLAQQLSGINSIVMYGVGLLSELLAANSAILNVGVAGLNVLVTVSAAPLVDKIGRKTCLLLSIGGMGTMSILLAIGIMRHIPVLSAMAVILFVASFGLGLGPVPFILSSELVGAEAVGATQSWALAANWIATFVVAQFFPIVNDALPKGHVYFIFAGFAVLFGAFVALRVPETMGKSDADEVWGRKKSPDRED